MTRFGGVINTMISRPLRRARLRRVLQRLPKRSGVTVVIPVRNRSGLAVENTLRALRRQTYARELIQISIVDYASDPEHASWLSAAAVRHDAVVVRVTDAREWNKPHCLNVGIRRASTRYLAVLDADIVLASDYLEEAIAELERDPLQVVLNQILDLAERDNLPADFTDADLIAAKRKAVPRTPGLYHEGTLVTTLQVVTQLRGYDENFKRWGAEDNDIVNRLENYAMNLTTLATKTYYLHQWHPLYDGADPELIGKQFQANWAYLTSVQRKLVRNPQGWGATRPTPSN